MHLRFCSFVIVVTCAAIASCGGSDSAGDGTYHGEIRALIEANCVGCHQDGGIGPFRLDDPDTVKALAGSIVGEVETRRMPPWGMEPDCREVTGSARLSDEQVAAFVAWRDNGFPEGDPADYKAPKPSEIRRTRTAEEILGAPDISLEPAEPYTPDAQRPDDYRCIVMPHTFDRDTFVYATDVIPDKLDVVHHVIVFVVPEADVPAVEEFDAADPGPGYNCFSDTGIEGADAIGGWVPGSQAGSASSEVAIRVSRGSRVVVQMHYNIAGRDPADIPGDATSVALWTLPEGQYPSYLLTSLWVPNVNLDIPAGEAQSLHSATMRFPVDGLAVAVSPHMHLLGKTINTDLIRPNGNTECLTRVDDWDFDWQRNYEFAESAAVPISISDEIRITCGYDNSPANQPVVNGVRRDPTDVTWGEGTYDEMCLDSISIITEFRGQGDTGVCAGFRSCFDDCNSSDPFCALSCMTSSSFACLTCGTEGLFGACAEATCPSQAGAIDLCLFTCVETETDVYGCLYDECRSQYEAYYACVEPTLKSGSCASDFAACEGIAP